MLTTQEVLLDLNVHLYLRHLLKTIKDIISLSALRVQKKFLLLKEYKTAFSVGNRIKVAGTCLWIRILGDPGEVSRDGTRKSRAKPWTGLSVQSLILPLIFSSSLSGD